MRAGLFVLAGELGQKNGEKKLRSLVARCPEWHSDVARLALADALAGLPSCVRLVDCLRGRDTMAVLRKADLICLARSWGYRSNQWQRRRLCSRSTFRAIEPHPRLAGAAAVAGKPPPMLALLPPMLALLPPLQPAGGYEGGGGPLSGLTGSPVAAPLASHSLLTAQFSPFESVAATPQALSAYVAEVLLPLLQESRLAYRGDAARAAAVSGGRAHLTATVASAISRTLALMPSGGANFGAAAAAIEAERAACGASELSSPAWLALLSFAPDAAANSAQQMLASLIRSSKQGIAEVCAARRRPECAGGPEVVWLDELYSARLGGLQFMLRADALLTSSRFGSLACFLGTAAVVMQLVLRHFDEVTESMAHRSAWVYELLARDRQAGRHQPGRGGGDDGDAEAAAAAETLLYVVPEFLRHRSA
jgi:hypothetical protein